MTAKPDLAVSPLKARSVSDTCVPSSWPKLSALVRGVEPKSDGEQIRRKKGRKEEMVRLILELTSSTSSSVSLFRSGSY